MTCFNSVVTFFAALGACITAVIMFLQYTQSKPLVFAQVGTISDFDIQRDNRLAALREEGFRLLFIRISSPHQVRTCKSIAIPGAAIPAELQTFDRKWKGHSFGKMHSAPSAVHITSSSKELLFPLLFCPIHAGQTEFFLVTKWDRLATVKTPFSYADSDVSPNA